VVVIRPIACCSSNGFIRLLNAPFQALYTIPALIVFAVSQNVDWLVGVTMGLGSAIGAYVATRVSVKGGDRVIRRFVAVAFALMAIRLFVDL